MVREYDAKDRKIMNKCKAEKNIENTLFNGTEQIDKGLSSSGPNLQE